MQNAACQAYGNAPRMAAVYTAAVAPTRPLAVTRPCKVTIGCYKTADRLLTASQSKSSADCTAEAISRRLNEPTAPESVYPTGWPVTARRQGDILGFQRGFRERLRQPLTLSSL